MKTAWWRWVGGVLWALAVVVGVVALSERKVEGHYYPDPIALEDLAKMSEMIIVGRCTSVDVWWPDNQGYVFIKSLHVSIDESLKGNLKDDVIIKRAGAGDMLYHVEIKINRKYVFFLEQSGSDGLYRKSTDIEPVGTFCHLQVSGDAVEGNKYIVAPRSLESIRRIIMGGAE